MKRKLFFLFLFIVASVSCSMAPDEPQQVKQVVLRYDQLLAEGYRTLNMNPMQEAATVEQATKLYHHMSAIGEGRLRMESTLKRLDFTRMEFPKKNEAAVETREVWDFVHVDIKTGTKYAEEKDFIYEVGYVLKKEKGRWIVTNVTTISGKSTNTIIPWPEPERHKGEPPNHWTRSNQQK